MTAMKHCHRMVAQLVWCTCICVRIELAASIQLRSLTVSSQVYPYDGQFHALIAELSAKLSRPDHPMPVNSSSYSACDELVASLLDQQKSEEQSNQQDDCEIEVELLGKTRSLKVDSQKRLNFPQKQALAQTFCKREVHGHTLYDQFSVFYWNLLKASRRFDILILPFSLLLC